MILISKEEATHIRNVSPGSSVVTINRHHGSRAKKYMVENTSAVRRALGAYRGKVVEHA